MKVMYDRIKTNDWLIKGMTEEQIQKEKQKVFKENERKLKRQVIIKCPGCGSVIEFKNWFHWVWCCPFHWFGRRFVECDECGLQFYGKREK